jgi:hypothetical protein
MVRSCFIFIQTNDHVEDHLFPAFHGLFLALQSQLPAPSYNTPGVYIWNTGNYIFTNVTIRAWGGGGGGGTGSQGNGGGGGGGSAFAQRIFAPIGPNQTVTFQVGAGGIAGVPGGNAGQTSQTSYFYRVGISGDTVRSGGGGGQLVNYYTGGLGGVSSGPFGLAYSGGGGANRSGQNGGGGGSSAGTGANGVTATGPDGATAPTGGGSGGSSGISSNDPAFPGLPPGGGGGGCQVQGGAGASGRITIAYASYEEGPPLPVELVFFHVLAEGRDARLIWRTASETNSWYYSVEHSAEGRDFREVGEVEAAGYSTSIIDYIFTHQAEKTGTHYYRLRQVDFDGRFEYSPIRVIQIEGTEAVAPFRAWSDGAQVWVEDFRAEGPGSFRILDLRGRILAVSALEKGSDARSAIGMPAVPGGLYLLQWQLASGAPGQTVKFLYGAF